MKSKTSGFHKKAIIFFLGCSLLPSCSWGELTVARAVLANNGQSWVPEDIHLLATQLKDAPVPVRSEFALAVLSELILAYSGEAVRARSEVQRGSADGDLPRWTQAVDALVLDLQRLLGGLLPETPVQVSADDPQTVYLVVDGSPVLLSGPRTTEKTLLERRVLERFCSRNQCNDLLPERQLETPIPGDPHSPPLWSFSDVAGPVCTSGDGLELQFRDASDLERKREACARVVAELNALAVGLRAEISRGTRVDWDLLAINSTADADLQHIVLNAEGDFLPMSVPSLAKADELFGYVLPWLAARVANKRHNLVILNSETKLELLAPAVDR